MIYWICSVFSFFLFLVLFLLALACIMNMEEVFKWVYDVLFPYRRLALYENEIKNLFCSKAYTYEINRAVKKYNDFVVSRNLKVELKPYVNEELIDTFFYYTEKYKNK